VSFQAENDYDQLRQCGGHEFHEISEWEELFLNDEIQWSYGRNWKRNILVFRDL